MTARRADKQTDIKTGGQQDRHGCRKNNNNSNNRRARELRKQKR